MVKPTFPIAESDEFFHDLLANYHAVNHYALRSETEK